MPANSTILSNAPRAQVLASNDIARGSLFGARVNPRLPFVIYTTYTILKKIYDIDPDYPNMRANCLYLWEIMGKYGIQAQGYTSGGGMIAVPSYGGMPDKYEFVVDGSSFIPTGGSAKTISAFIGYNLEFVRGGVPQYELTSQPTYFSWNKTTGLFTCTPALEEGEVVSLSPM